MVYAEKGICARPVGLISAHVSSDEIASCIVLLLRFIDAKRSRVARERLAQVERTSAREDVREYRGQRSAGRRCRHHQIVLFRGGPRQATNAQHLHPGAQVSIRCVYEFLITSTTANW